VGVRPLDSREGNRRLTETVLSDDKLSAPTQQILNRSGLEKQFQSEPVEVIAVLHKALPTAREADRLFALAELSFLHAAKSGDRSYFLAAAVYAYAFLFPQDPGASPDPFDPRLRTAVDLYNRGLSGGFAEPENRQVLIPEKRRVILEEGVYKLPFGELSVHIDPDEFRYGPFRMVNFVDTAELDVRGLRNTYRWPGIGASLAAALKHRPGAEEHEFARVPAEIRVAATAFLREAAAQLPASGLAGAGSGVKAYPPVPPALARVADVERVQMLVESRSRPALQRALAAWLPGLVALHRRHRGVIRWAVDVDPLAI
jgi:hypothetical protein